MVQTFLWLFFQVFHYGPRVHFVIWHVIITPIINFNAQIAHGLANSSP